jgi:hypothetical protein
MQTRRFFLFVFLCMIIFVSAGYGQISSWTDENGVRHFSNVEASEEDKTVKNMEEYKTDPSDEAVEHKRDRFKILRMLEEDRENEAKQKAMEQEIRESEEKDKKEQEAAEELARERKRACAELMKKLDDLRHSKWEEYDAPHLSPISCPDRRWKGARGKVFDNMKECTERRDRARKNAYERAIRRQEEEAETLCSQ